MNRSLFVRFLSMLIVLFISGSAFSQQVESSSYGKMLQKRLPKNVPSIDVSEVDTNNHSIVFLDTREHDEYHVSHIKNAHYIGYKKADLEAILKLPKSTEIIVYCSIGYRSGKISKQLMEAGFVNVKNLYGGLFEWSNQEMPMVDADGKRTTKIHPYSKRWGRWITSGEKVFE